MPHEIDSANLLDRAEQLVQLALKAGAEKADAVVVRSRSKGVSVRLGKVESTEASESDDFSLRVSSGAQVASVSANPGFDLTALAERAVAMARVSPEDPFAGLADESDLASTIADLELYDPTEVSSDSLRESALAMEEAARSVSGVSNSLGAGASAGMGGLVLVTSHGFSGSYAGSRFSRSVGVIAGEGHEDGARPRFRQPPLFRRARQPGRDRRRAAERAIRRLNRARCRPPPTSPSSSTLASHVGSSAPLPGPSTVPPSLARHPSCAIKWASRS